LAKESEIKLRIEDLPATRLKCIQLGAVETQFPCLEENLVFDQPGRPLLNQGKLLRVRQYAGKVLVTFKGPLSIRDSIKHREEVEFLLDSMTVFAHFLESLGYAVQFRYQKYRQVFHLSETCLKFAAKEAIREPARILKIMVDETPIGNFMELEGDEDLIHQASSLFGFTRADYITQSYADLFAQERQRQGWAEEDMIFKK
jgi:adenylate cyclase, class 2